MAEPFTRRDFASRIAVAAVASGAAVAAADPVQSAKTRAKNDQPAGPQQPVDLILELVKQQYPHPRLDATALEEIGTDIRQNLARSQVLSQFTLTNANEPGFVFSAWRADRAR